MKPQFTPLLRPLLAAFGALALVMSAPSVAQNALDDVMKAKEIKIAIPTDFPPYGFVGTDLKLSLIHI